jgi:addiction module RelB/DinJ family antitoxin
MTTTTINVRLDPKIKKSAQKVLEDIGLDLSTGIRLFLRNVSITKSLSVPVRTVDGYREEYMERLMQEVTELEADIAAGKVKGYTDVAQMHRDILKRN